MCKGKQNFLKHLLEPKDYLSQLNSYHCFLTVYIRICKITGCLAETNFSNGPHKYNVLKNGLISKIITFYSVELLLTAQSKSMTGIINHVMACNSKVRHSQDVQQFLKLKKKVYKIRQKMQQHIL